MTPPAPFLPRTAGHESEVAVRAPGGTLTWAALEIALRRIANGFTALGAGEGERVAVMAGNCPEWVAIIAASLRGGMKVVPVNWHLTAAEVAYVLEDAGAKVLVCDQAHADTARDAAARAGVAHVLVIGDGFDRWCAAQDDAGPRNVRAGGPMFYTSGTTGVPKGVISRYRETTVADVWATFGRNARNYRIGHGGVHLLACPVYHAAPFMHVVLAFTSHQGVVVMPRFDAEEFLRLVDAHRVTNSHVVPMQMARLLELPDDVKGRYDTSSLRGIVHGAAPCPPWVKQGLIAWLGPVVNEYYASSEGAGLTFATSDDWLARPGTVGRPPPGIEVQVADDDGRPLPPGEAGTIYFRRPGMPPPEYHNAPEKSAESTLAGGWFTVGDVGWLDADGWLFLADRRIDMIISGGVNIYPAEVEAALSEHPAVADCAVFGVPDDEWGESVKAVVVLASGAPATDEAALIAWCRERIAHFKCPRSVDFRDALPREASGKLMKRKLRDRYWEGRERRI